MNCYRHIILDEDVVNEIYKGNGFEKYLNDVTKSGWKFQNMFVNIIQKRDYLADAYSYIQRNVNEYHVILEGEDGLCDPDVNTLHKYIYGE